jgi:hypothetical protein
MMAAAVTPDGRFQQFPQQQQQQPMPSLNMPRNLSESSLLLTARIASPRDPLDVSNHGGFDQLNTGLHDQNNSSKILSPRIGDYTIARSTSSASMQFPVGSPPTMFTTAGNKTTTPNPSTLSTKKVPVIPLLNLGKVPENQPLTDFNNPANSGTMKFSTGGNQQQNLGLSMPNPPGSGPAQVNATGWFSPAESIYTNASNNSVYNELVHPSSSSARGSVMPLSFQTLNVHNSQATPRDALSPLTGRTENSDVGVEDKNPLSSVDIDLRPAAPSFTPASNVGNVNVNNASSNYGFSMNASANPFTTSNIPQTQMNSFSTANNNPFSNTDISSQGNITNAPAASSVNLPLSNYQIKKEPNLIANVNAYSGGNTGNPNYNNPGSNASGWMSPHQQQQQQPYQQSQQFNQSNYKSNNNYNNYNANTFNQGGGGYNSARKKNSTYTPREFATMNSSRSDYNSSEPNSSRVSFNANTSTYNFEQQQPQAGGYLPTTGGSSGSGMNFMSPRQTQLLQQQQLQLQQQQQSQYGYNVYAPQTQQSYANNNSNPNYNSNAFYNQQQSSQQYYPSNNTSNNNNNNSPNFNINSITTNSGNSLTTQQLQQQLNQNALSYQQQQQLLQQQSQSSQQQHQYPRQNQQQQQQQQQGWKQF